uniref:Uncharacterized protein n=1 Tax=Onchocerca volvulus TaxID=6282 RepID=A0A8R1XNA3_ONCVO
MIIKGEIQSRWKSYNNKVYIAVKTTISGIPNQAISDIPNRAIYIYIYRQQKILPNYGRLYSWLGSCHFDNDNDFKPFGKEIEQRVRSMIRLDPAIIGICSDGMIFFV